jgi:hypothetical protein
MARRGRGRGRTHARRDLTPADVNAYILIGAATPDAGPRSVDAEVQLPAGVRLVSKRPQLQVRVVPRSAPP